MWVDTAIKFFFVYLLFLITPYSVAASSSVSGGPVINVSQSSISTVNASVRFNSSASQTNTVSYSNIAPVTDIAWFSSGDRQNPSFIFLSPTKSLFELVIPYIASVVSLIVGMFFNAFLWDRSRRNQLEDLDRSKRENFGDEFWFRKTLLPLIQDKAKRYADQQIEFWSGVQSDSLEALENYLEWTVQGEHHDILLMVEKMQVFSSKAISDDILTELYEVYDKVELGIAEIVLEIQTGISEAEIKIAKGKARSLFFGVEYSTVLAFKQPHEKVLFGAVATANS